MYKNQLQELAQRSCFGLPSYSCIREGPDHAPRFKATVNFNGEVFESPAFFSTLRHAEHAAAEVALNTLAMTGPSRALTARVLDETGVYKNLLQETAHRAGLNLPTYTTVRSRLGHVPNFSCTVELGGMSFVGPPSRTKKQAQKNAAMAAWSALRKMTKDRASSSSSTSSSLDSKSCEEQEQAIVARFLTNLQPPNPKTKDKSTGYGPRGKNLYPVRCQGWAYSGFSPEMFVYNLLEEEKILQQQQHQMVMLPFVPSFTPHPRVFPLGYFPVRQPNFDPVGPGISIATSRPYLCLSDPTCSRSTVTIQEIHDEKTEESRDFSSASTSGRSHGEDSSSTRPHSSARISHTVNSALMYPRPPSPQPSRGGPIRCIRPSQSSAVKRVGPSPVSANRVVTRNPQMYSPVRMRSGGNTGAARPCFLAPPVRIRSVVPVCSAPPPTVRAPVPRQESTSERSEKKVTEIDDTCLELGDLQL